MTKMHCVHESKRPLGPVRWGEDRHIRVARQGGGCSAALRGQRGGVRGVRGPRTSAAEAQARHALADNADVVVRVAGLVFWGRGGA